MRYKGNSDHNVDVDQNIVSNLSGFYQHRNMLQIRSPKIRGPQLSIMTYNIWTQCPKRRYRDGDGNCYGRPETAALLDYISEFSKQCAADYGVSDCYTFLAGDFNSTPNDDAYMALVSKPFHFDAAITGDPSHLLKIETSHNDIPLRAVSLYSAGYHLVHLENSNINNSRNEPHFFVLGTGFSRFA
ncbi:hypothetical protein HF325_006990 [Metschnikowia pulcherrima]|uniref:Endonuclease/exonuclease/phosphatase domain-containing protein n=1 Tax=Metschnikowia pulcherrima TaxID=27326 RepID=A0A8H7GKF1_9ASCO|nr:hypothetical protein HF325_006990 [Metschnikowia pulcherrima]